MAELPMDEVWIQSSFLRPDEERTLTIAEGVDFVVDRDGHTRAIAEGMAVVLFDDDLNEVGEADTLFVRGVVERNRESGNWVARIDWGGFGYVSGRAWRG
jgi:hypothetical protein